MSELTPDPGRADLFRAADFLIRFSGVPLPAIASTLGFSEPRGFSRWFENQGGEHPESARVDPARDPVHDSVRDPDERHLFAVRQALATVLEPSATAPLIRALRHRRPVSPKTVSPKTVSPKTVSPEPGADHA